MPAYLIVDALLRVLLVLVVLAGLAFWLYWPATIYMAFRIRREKDTPRGFFASAVVAQIGLVVVLFFLLFPIVLMPLLGFLTILFGILGWIVLIVLRIHKRVEIRKYHAAHPLPGIQYTMRDIYMAVFFYAAAMAMCTVGSHAASGQTIRAVIMWAAYLFLSTVMGFFTALDVCRREPNPIGTQKRPWVMLAILLFFSVSGIIPGLLAWCSLRKALRVVGMERWRRDRPVSPRGGRQGGVT